MQQEYTTVATVLSERKEMVIIGSYIIELVTPHEVLYTAGGNAGLPNEKGGLLGMVGQRTVNASLQNDKGTWVVRGRVYDPLTGKTKQRTKTTGLKVRDNTKRKAELVKREIVDEWTAEANGGSTKNGPVLDVYIQKWIEHKRRLGVKENTIKSYMDYSRVHITPKLGSIPVKRLTLKDVEKFYDEYLKTHTVNSARKVHVVIVGALHEAIRDGIIQFNLAKEMEFPRGEKYTGAKTLSENEIARLLNAAKEAGEPICAAITLALAYGLRRSEVLGLRWSDIDFEKVCLTISNTIVQNGNLWIEAEDTKTAKSHRILALTGKTKQYLMQLWKMQAENGLLLDKVCAWPDGRRVTPDYVSKRTKRLLRDNKLPIICFHDLRHTAISLLAPYSTPKEIMDFSGHENVNTTYGVYTHIMDEQRAKMAQRTDAIWEKAGIVF